MAAGLDARQVLMLAHEIEVVGQTAFQRLAGIAADPGTASLFRELAEDEGKHERLFSGMRARLARGEGVAERLDAVQIRKMNADLAGFECRCPTDVLRELKGSESEEESLRKALEFEKGTVALFRRMRDRQLPGLDLGGLDAIIAEELEHISALQNRLDHRDSPSPR